MLHRSTSSRRRRSSRSAASSPQTRNPRSGTVSASTSPGRRASIAVSPVEPCGNIEKSSRNLIPEINRSPRHSLVPDISLSHNSLEPDSPTRIHRNSLVPEMARSPRNSLVPDNYSRSPRNSLVPDCDRSPRNSLIPDSAMSPRNSLIPDNHNRSPRNSLVPDQNRSPRNSLVPDNNRSPRHSLTPEAYGSRINLAPDFNRSPRNSLVPDYNRSSRHSLVLSESTTWNQRSNPNQDDSGSRSPRHTSPRGSIAPEPRTSPRESIVSISEYPDDRERSPRGSLGMETHNRSPRGSIGLDSRSQRNHIDSRESRCSRGSLTLTFQEPPASERRYSADNQNVKPIGRSTSPYRMSLRGPHVNFGYSASAMSDTGSRRASSCVSQVSGDEQRRLCCEHTKLSSAAESGLPLGISLATYGSVAYQLKDANMEASGTCDFVCRALRIVHKTVAVTVVLVCLSTLPLLMLIMGIQFLRDCPKEPHIPVYMVVGGSFGCVKMAWVLYRQLSNRRMDSGVLATSSAGSRVASLALTVFLVAWFALGNYWILKIKWPDYTPTLYEPNRWCHRTLYVFAVVHLCVVYSVFVVIFILVIMLASCQLVGCPWLGPTRYK